MSVTVLLARTVEMLQTQEAPILEPRKCQWIDQSPLCGLVSQHGPTNIYLLNISSFHLPVNYLPFL